MAQRRMSPAFWLAMVGPISAPPRRQWAENLERTTGIPSATIQRYAKGRDLSLTWDHALIKEVESRLKREITSFQTMLDMIPEKNRTP